MLPSSKFALISLVVFIQPSPNPFPDRPLLPSFPIGVNPTKYYGYPVSADFAAAAAHARHDAPLGRSTLKTRLFLISSGTASLPIMVAVAPRSSQALRGTASPPRVEDHNTSVHTLGIRQLAMPWASGFWISSQRGCRSYLFEAVYTDQGSGIGVPKRRVEMCQIDPRLLVTRPAVPARRFFASVCRAMFRCVSSACQRSTSKFSMDGISLLISVL